MKSDFQKYWEKIYRVAKKSGEFSEQELKQMKSYVDTISWEDEKAFASSKTPLTKPFSLKRAGPKELFEKKDTDKK